MEQYKSLKRFEELDVNKLRRIYGEIRTKVIEPITIRRTRTDLENIIEYKLDLAAQGIIFPQVEPPQKVEYLMDEKLNELFHKTVICLTGKEQLTYSRYQAIAGLNPEIQSKYYENAETVSKSLAFIMKTQLVKRLESSFYAFKKSLTNFQQATDRMITMFANDKIFIAPDTNINKLLDKGWSEEEIEKEIERLSEENPKNKTFKSTDFKPDFIESLEKDSQILQELVKDWNAIENDPKLDVFINKLNNLFFDKKTNLEGKLVIFSESKDTVNYLSQALNDKFRKDVLVVSSENRKQLYDTIVTNFDANCAVDKQVNDYSIIITTEVLAEGVNLHRSNVIIHYDTPWNSTKLMQRIGRVNRIGTKANAIYNYVFYPSAQGDSQIQLNKTAFMKIQAFHTAFGEDNQVFSTDEILDEVKLFSGNYQEEQDERLKFLYFLRNFRKKHKAWFDKIKKMPLKSRVGRSSTRIKKPDLENGTIAFLKTDKKFEFYWIDSNNQPKEITPLAAFKIFEAEENEKNCELIANHHDHVNQAIEHFQNLEHKLVQSQIDPEALGGVAQNAKKFLSQIINHPKLTANQRENIKKIITLIDIGKYANLPADVDKLQKKKLKLDVAILELNKITQKYSVDSANFPKGEKRKVEKPVLIISESFM
jgi:superfamily II DNA/RNA helicase